MISPNELSGLNLLLELLSECARVIDQKALFCALEKHIKWIMPFSEMVLAFSDEKGGVESLLIDRGEGIHEEPPSSSEERIKIILEVIQKKSPQVNKDGSEISTICFPIQLINKNWGALLFYSKPAHYIYKDIRIIGYIAQYIGETLLRLKQEETIKGQILELETKRQESLLFAEREMTRSQIEKALEKEKEAVRYRDEFLSIASHELKTPLTTLKLQLQLAEHKIKNREKEDPSIEQLKINLGYCMSQCIRLELLVKELLDASCIQSGRLSSHFEEIELGDLVDATLEQFSEQLSAVHCEVTRIKSEGAYVLCDVVRVGQVLANLLTNVMKYAPGKPLVIAIQKTAKTARVTVQDHGMGIPPDQLERIFLRFERVATSRNINGLGLGLYISREYMLAQKGSLTVESQLGKGSTFIMTFPLLDLAAAKQMDAS